MPLDTKEETFICSHCRLPRTRNEMGRRSGGVDPRCKRCKASVQRERHRKARGLPSTPHNYRPATWLSNDQAVDLIASVPADFGHWFAGFFDGEGHLFIDRNGRCGAVITLRADDRPALEMIRDHFGVGALTNQIASNGSQVSNWRAASRNDCRIMAAVFTRFPLRAKKARELDIWLRAVELWVNAPTYDGSASERRIRNASLWRDLIALKTELQSARKVQ